MKPIFFRTIFMIDIMARPEMSQEEKCVKCAVAKTQLRNI